MSQCNRSNRSNLLLIGAQMWVLVLSFSPKNSQKWQKHRSNTDPRKTWNFNSSKFDTWKWWNWMKWRTWKNHGISFLLAKHGIPCQTAATFEWWSRAGGNEGFSNGNVGVIQGHEGEDALIPTVILSPQTFLEGPESWSSFEFSKSGLKYHTAGHINTLSIICNSCRYFNGLWCFSLVELKWFSLISLQRGLCFEEFETWQGRTYKHSCRGERDTGQRHTTKFGYKHTDRQGTKKSREVRKWLGSLAISPNQRGMLNL